MPLADADMREVWRGKANLTTPPIGSGPNGVGVAASAMPSARLPQTISADNYEQHRLESGFLTEQISLTEKRLLLT